MHDEKGGGGEACCDNCGNCGSCGCGPGGYHGGKKAKLYFFAGTLAIVYGIINYLVSTGWPGYQAWIAGGVLLVIIGVLKKHMSH